MYERDFISHAQLFTFYTLAVDTLYSSISVGRRRLRGSPGGNDDLRIRVSRWCNEAKDPFSFSFIDDRRGSLLASFFLYE